MSDIIFIENNLKGMAVFGLWDIWQTKNPIKQAVFNIYGQVIFFFFITFNITEFIEMYKVLTNILLLMGNAGISLLYFVASVKAYTLLYKKHRVSELLSVMREKEKIIFSRDERQNRIYKASIARNWFLTKLFWFVCVSTFIMFIIARFIEYWYLGPQEIYGYKVPFIFSSWFPFNKFAPGNYEIAYFIQFMGGCIGSWLIATLDTFMVACMIFAISQFKLVQDRIMRLHEETEDPDSYSLVVDIIKEHVGVIDFLIRLDDLIKTIIFINFLTCSLLIGSVGLEGIISGPSVRFGLNSYYLVALLIQLFLFYWHANEVSLESMKIAIAVSCSEWYRFSKRVQHALLLVMIRSQKPCILSVGGFYPMSLSTFLMILKTTYSFLALFRKVYTRE